MKRAQSIGVLAVVVAVSAVAIWVYAWYQTVQRNAQCVRNLEQIGAAPLTYANESEDEYFPSLSLVPGRLMFDGDAVYPTYLAEPTWLVSPFHPDYARLREQDNDPTLLIDDRSYWYLGYIFANERSALAWIDEYKRLLPEGQLPADVNEIWPEHVADLEERDKEAHARYEEAMSKRRADWIASGRQGEPPGIKMSSRAAPHLHEMHFAHVLRPGVERFLITDIGNPVAAATKQSEIPVMVERPELHGDGGHVLYMDGHVEFVPYPGPFPMTVTFIDGLRSLDRME